MIFKTTYLLTENQMKNVRLSPHKIIPDYKSLDDDLTDEKNWIDYHEEMIIDTSCDFVWERYCNDFSDKKILTKNLLYKLIRQQLDAQCKTVRLSENIVKNCFVRKST